MYIRTCYDSLIKVYRDKAYLANAIGRVDEDRELVTAICYGVVEKDYQLESIIGATVNKNPALPIRVVLKIGIYMLKYMSIPSYAVISNTVELVKDIGKGGLAGFVNAILRRVDRGEYDISLTGVEKLAFDTSTPVWLTRKIIAEYGENRAREILSFVPRYREHIRLNVDVDNVEDILSRLEVLDTSDEGGYFVKVNDGLRTLLKEGLVTYQSPSSMRIASLVASHRPAEVLDVCSAPGGKSVYIAQLLENSHVTACDVHEHRVSLIESYKSRMRVPNVTPTLLDGTQYKEEWNSRFDAVLCDVPCSGIGVRYTSPDILLNRTDKDIKSLSQLQYEILSNASRYLRSGGVLTYSTCTILRQENQQVVDKFLKEHKDYELLPLSQEGKGYLTILPMDSGIDGFFVAQMRKK